MNIKREIDHFVFAVPDLEEAIDWFESITGCRPIFGGYHTTQGTKNALVNLGNKCYLEFLAIDDENRKFKTNRWMGIDLIEKSQTTRWALKSFDLDRETEILKLYNPELAKIKGGQRKTPNGKMLNWQLTMPLSKPKVELIPFLIDWQNSEAHPTDNLPQECELVGVEFRSPNSVAVSNMFKKLSIDTKVVKGNFSKIRLQIKSVMGGIEI